MSAATSPGTGLAYGLRRVCAAWGMARSSFYAMTSGQHAEQPPAKRRGPKPAISDQALLVAIEADLEASPWEGEGYRKVWARLRVCRDIRVARKRVLRLMRENNLLSPHRCRRRGGNPHDGEIITHAPNLMWGTDGVRVFTVDDGWGWIFTAIEHWNAECVGWHVCKRGDRFAALQPISMGLARLYDSTSAGAARGLALQMDHGSQYLSDHLHQPDQVLGSSRPTPSSPSPYQRRRRAVQSHAEGTDHPWSHLPQHRGAAGRRPRLRFRRKERLPEPRSSSSGVARRDLNQARRVNKLVSKEPGALHVLGGVSIAATITVLAMSGGIWLSPGVLTPVDDLENRLAFVSSWDLLVVFWLLATIGALGNRRFLSPEDIDGSGLTSGTAEAKILQSVLQNTLEQVVLAVIVHVACAVLLPIEWMAALPVAAILFALGRSLFWRGYHRGAPARALGFGLTLYPTVLLLALLIAQMFLAN